jgi:hypothetical protein
LLFLLKFVRLSASKIWKKGVQMKLGRAIRVPVLGLTLVAVVFLVFLYAAFLDESESRFLEEAETSTPSVGLPTVVIWTPTSEPEPTTTPSPIPVPTPTPTPAQVPTVVPDEPVPTITPEVPEPQPTPTPEPTQVPVNVSADLAGLRENLAGEISSYEIAFGADLSIAVTDLQTGERIAIDGNEVHHTGCVANFFGLLSLVDYLQSNEADPAPYEVNVLQGISGSLPWHVAVFLRNAYGSTDEGVAAGKEIIEEVGLASTVYGNIPGYPADDTSPNFRPNQITAADANLVLESLWRGEIFSPTWTEYTLTKMREVANWGLRYIIPDQLPVGATVAHKIGYYPDSDGWLQNNVGIVTFVGDDGAEKAYAISFLSEKSPTEYGAAFFGAYLSRLVWDYFATKY